LVRLNVGGNLAIEKSAFTISRVDNEQFVHTRVYPTKTGGTYVKIDDVVTKVDGSLTDLIRTLQTQKSGVCGDVAFGYPYESLFTEVKRSGAYQVTNYDGEDDI